MEKDVWARHITKNYSFVMKKSAITYHDNGLYLLRACVLKEKYKYNEDYFDNIYKFFVISQKIVNGNLYEACKNWLAHLQKLKPRNFKVLFPINYYDPVIEFKFNNFKIIKWCKDVLYSDFNIPATHESVTYIEEMVKNTKTDAFAVIDVDAFDLDGAKAIAYSMIEKFIHAIKLLDPESSVKFGRERAIKLSEMAIVKDGTMIMTKTDDDVIPTYFHLEDDIDDLPSYIAKLMSFLYTENPTDLQKAVLTALYWFGISDDKTDSKERLFLNYIIGLESILLHKNWGNKAVKFGKHYVKIFSNDRWNMWKDTYEKRNQIIHGGSADIYGDEIDKMRLDLRLLLFRLIEWSDDYDELNDALKDKYGIDNKNTSHKQKTCSK